MLEGTCHCGACGRTLAGDPGPVTACNCTPCRRYGALWACDWADERIAVTGPLATYVRPDRALPARKFLFCRTCAGVVAWRGLDRDEDGRRRIAVNVRLSPPEAVADLPIAHFDGLDSFADLTTSGHRVRDLWS